MSINIMRRLAPLAALLALILAAAVPGPARGLTIEEERELGEEVFAAVIKHKKVVKDAAIQSYVNTLGQKILKNVGPQPFKFRFFVLDDPVINAFAVPGGYIFVHSGILTAMHSEGELAAIIGHEIAHVTSRHVSQRMTQNRNLGIATIGGVLAGALLGGPAGQALVMGSMGANIQAQLAYSRSDEREADRKGLNYLVEAGYDPRFMASSFQTMLRQNWAAPEGVPTYLTTHPGLSERISSVEAAVATHAAYQKVLGRGDEKAFSAIQNRTLAFVADPLQARNHFQGMLKENSNDPNAHYGLAMLAQKEQNYDQAIQEYQVALKADPANANYLADLGSVQFAKNDMDAAMSSLSRAVVLRPNMVRALFLLGRCYEERGAADRALELYEKVLDLDPTSSDGLYRAGLLYGQKGDLARAHLHTGLYFQLEGQRQKAYFHFRKAEENAASAPPGVKDRIDNGIWETMPPEERERLKKQQEQEEFRRKNRKKQNEAQF